MTRIIVELSRQSEIKWLLGLLQRLGIPYKEEEVSDDLQEAYSVLEKGCDMENFGDPEAYQRQVRTDRFFGSERQ